LSDQPPKSLASTLQVFIDIARLRRGPEDLPFDRSLLLGTIVTFALLNLGIGHMSPDGELPPLALVLIEVTMMLVSLRLMLQIANRSERFVQTATAMFGFQVVLVPAQLLVAWLSLRYVTGNSVPAPVLLLWAAVAIWTLIVATRILRSATGWPTAVCVAMILTVGMVTSLLLVLLYPHAFASASQS
jgi:hypothetical protein